jgi:hypothetical protein
VEPPGPANGGGTERQRVMETKSLLKSHREETWVVFR